MSKPCARWAATSTPPWPGFIRGQGTVCLLLGFFYAVALSLAGLKFGLAIGLLAGASTFIPYAGALIGGVLAIGVALVQFWPDFWSIALVAAIFGAGQFLEGNFLSPKLVGKSVGLHPVWLMFALFAFGYAFGFVGLLLAVPLAAAAGVLVRFGLGQYLASRLYLGAAEDAGAGAGARRPHRRGAGAGRRAPGQPAHDGPVQPPAGARSCPPRRAGPRRFPGHAVQRRRRRHGRPLSRLAALRRGAAGGAGKRQVASARSVAAGRGRPADLRRRTSALEPPDQLLAGGALAIDDAPGAALDERALVPPSQPGAADGQATC